MSFAAFCLLLASSGLFMAGLALLIFACRTRPVRLNHDLFQ